MNYVFSIDTQFCSGCKACQVACKDKNNLPVGVLWRRVYEVSGGSWIKQGEAWVTDVFAYNLSIACNHCVHPKCAGVCPAEAYTVREDGIVLLDESKCIGCRYCAWACPYGAPQYEQAAGRMTKCNLCVDNLEQGLPPACVAACPMRVLDFVNSDERQKTSGWDAMWEIPGTEHPFPMPSYSCTEPRLAIKPHVAMMNGLEKVISNQEEIRPPSTQRKAFVPFMTKDFSELPLVIFTLLGQMAAGMAVFSLLIPHSFFLILSIGFLLGIGGLFSFLHLGTMKNAWRAIFNLKKSWLSREVLMAGLFGASWLVLMIEHWSLNTDYWLLITALLGLGLVYSMAQVYRLRSVSAWNIWRTTAGFFVTTALLGLICSLSLLAAEALWKLNTNDTVTSVSGGGYGLFFLMALEGALMLRDGKQIHRTARQVRGSLILLGMAGAVILLFVPNQVGMWMTFPIFLIIFIEAMIGRVLFYESRFLRDM